ncbi:MAG TPA: SDR family oxidoreductase [Streptosporangiaceae bacterium]|jgi:meso-butanediol dehydrogenase/(S,S)-butanediol dehydrogenase/diacetyl reductase|nr:SDR family oxidoreductase [Streptosporangiaceae bacterium]
MRAVIVGSGSVVAQRVIEALAARGAEVAGIDITVFDHPALRASLVADMSDEREADAAVDEAAAVLGGLDVLVTGAANQQYERLGATTARSFREVVTGTLDTTFFAMRAALRHLGPGGAIVAISSVNAYLAHPGASAYAASKGAINALVTQAALDYAPRGIRVNAVAPALIDGFPDTDLAAGYPMGRTPTSREVADAVAFLASPQASGITGVILPVDAGLSITSPAALLRPALRERLFADVPAARAENPPAPHTDDLAGARKGRG